MAGNRSTLISLVHDANATQFDNISITQVSPRGGYYRDTLELTGVEPVSKLRSILEITYTIVG